MNKIKEWIRFKLRNFLGVDYIESNLEHSTKTINRELDTLSNSIVLNSNNLNLIHRDLKYEISHFQESVNVLHSTVENVVHIGVDASINPSYRSWAVVCVEGKMNIVKFVDLSGKDGRDILHFLKQYESGRHCIDAPYQELIYNGLFKF